jgi:hypothetical protein
MGPPLIQAVFGSFRTMNEVTREEDLDDEAFQIRHVFATFGLASYQGQVLERGLANVLTAARTHSLAGTRDDFDEFLAEHLAATMGRLITLLRPHLAGDDVLLVDLAQVLSTRNRLAHRFFREHELNFLSFTGREQMLAELMGAADEFERMDRRLKPVVSRFFRAYGLSDQEQKRMIDDEYAELERLARQRDDE